MEKLRGVFAKNPFAKEEKKLDTARVPASPLADDAEFVRRAHLDITGRIPTGDRVLAFLESKEPGKRAKLIDELLATREYGLHFATIWRNLMVRRDANQIRPPDTAELVKWRKVITDIGVTAD